jgi:aerobic-type carbon monoxide dehydrogenase small subunit (CoxS/CutS family)
MTEARTIRFTLNGTAVSASIMPHETLIEVLSQRFELRGARESCGQGLCGCCTVYVDPRRCRLYLAWLVDGANVVTSRASATDRSSIRPAGHRQRVSVRLLHWVSS